jgi:chromosome segregation ATPase
VKCPNDNQTLDLLEKPRRGRPVTGKAKTQAQIQRDYRQRKKLKQQLQGVSKPDQADQGQINFLSKLLQAERENTDRLADKVIELQKEVKRLKHEWDGTKHALDHQKFLLKEEREIANKFSKELHSLRNS